MSRWFLFALVSLPILEIAVLAKLIGSLGFILTVALLLAAAAAGTYLLRVQGLTTWMRTQQALTRGELPAREMLESGLVGLGALLLIIPGFVTDLIALFCLVPASRRRLAALLLKRLRVVPGPDGEARGPITIEGEFKRDE